MFGHRVFTSVVLVSCLFLAIRYLPVLWFSLLIDVVMVLAAWEWSSLSGIKSCYFRSLYLIFVLLALAVIVCLPILWISVTSFFVWLWAAAAVICYSKGIFPLGFQYNVTKIIVGFIVLTSCSVSGTVLRKYDVGGSGWFLFGLVLIWTTDLGSYLIGRRWGKRTLIVRVSPNKTWEGLWGGVFLTFAISVVVTLFVFRRSYFRLMLVDFLALVVSIFAVVGDLFESMLKRQVGVKDSGHLLPGHGGILDRIDSTLSALPIFLLGLLFLSK